MSGFFAKLFSHHRQDEPPVDEKAPEQAFWDWFAPNSEALRSATLDEFGMVDDDGSLGFDLGAALDEVAFGLGYEMRDGEEGTRELIFTADGDPELFPTVHRLVEAAPSGLTRWRITALRARPDGGDTATTEIGPIKINGVKLKPEDLYFTLRPESEAAGRIGVDLYHKRFAQVGPDSALEAANYFLTSALGEQLFEARIGEINTYDPPLLGEPAYATVRPFAEFPAAFDTRLAAGSAE